MTAETQVENARCGYQAAIQLWIYEGNLIWSKFYVMLVANTLILTAYGFVRTDHSAPGSLRHGLPAIGIFLCVIWLLTTKRGFDNYKYWIFSAREIEEQHLDPVVTVQRGGQYADGESVSLRIAGTAKIMRMSRITGKAATHAYVTIAVFTLFFIILQASS